MSKIPFIDINDDEIRIISSGGVDDSGKYGNKVYKEPEEIDISNFEKSSDKDTHKSNSDEKLTQSSEELDYSIEYRIKDKIYDWRDLSHKKKWKVFFIILIIGLIIISIIFFIVNKGKSDENNLKVQITETLESGAENIETTNIDATFNSGKQEFSTGFVQVIDTVVNKEPLTIVIPKNSMPRLSIGTEALSDSSATLVVQAADIRRDNGKIVGAYVYEGNLLSRGQSKAGFCAIINGKPIIGVADSTPYLEQAIDTDGFFFRQYPLVVGGQAIENKLKPLSLRKALAELNGETVVILSHNKMTLNEFSETLVNLGVTNAIYLVGSTAYGFAFDENGSKIEFGIEPKQPVENINYIVWK